MDIHISVYDPDELMMAAQFMQMIAGHRLNMQKQATLAQPCPPPGYIGSGKAAYDINRDTVGGMPMSGLDDAVTCDAGGVPMSATIDALLNVRDTPSYLSAQERLWSAIEAAAKP